MMSMILFQPFWWKETRHQTEKEVVKNGGSGDVFWGRGARLMKIFISLINEIY